jgi:hypothetical protein
LAFFIKLIQLFTISFCLDCHVVPPRKIKQKGCRFYLG